MELKFLSCRVCLLGIFVLNAFLSGPVLFADDLEDRYMNALMYQRIDKVEEYLEEGVDPDLRNEYGMSGLLYGAFAGNIELVQLFLKYKADINLQKPVEKASALHFAIKEGHFEMVEFLVENKANIDIVDAYNQTPLFVASMVGADKIVKLLVEKGADMNVANSNDFMALDIAAQNNHKKVVKILIKGGVKIDRSRKRGGTALGTAADKGNIEIMQMLIDVGADVNFKDGELGATPLMYAAYMNQYKAVKCLLKNGADKSIFDNSGNNACSYAKVQNNRRIVKLLE